MPNPSQTCVQQSRLKRMGSLRHISNHLGHGTIKGLTFRRSITPNKCRAMQSLQRFQKGTVSLQVVEGKLTLAWTEARAPLEPNAPTLAAGSCGLYAYPKVTFDGDDEKSSILEGSQLEQLDAMLLELQQEIPECMRARDATGSPAPLALLVANTSASLALAMQIYERQPSLIVEAHEEVPGGAAIFTGENCLHCLSANSHEDLLLRILRLAAAHLTPPQLAALLNSMCRGTFFANKPMCFYGGHPVSYMAVFKAKAALELLFRTPALVNALEVSTRSDGMRGLQEDSISGYSPLHALVASGLDDMYDFVSRLPARLPPESAQIAAAIFNPHHKSKGVSAFRSVLTPLQLACKLGDQLMVLHLLQGHAEIEWKWGPVTKYQFELSEIDSCASSLGSDVMELIVAHDAQQQTQKLISDEFMDGMIFQLFEAKWRTFAARLHYTQLGLDGLLLGLLLVLGFSLKEDPVGCDRFVTPTLILATAGVLFTFELLGFCRWWRQQREGGGRLIPCSIMLAEFVRWCRANDMVANLVREGVVFTVGVVTLGNADNAHNKDGTGDEVLWFLTSIASLVQFSEFISECFVPFHQMGVFALSVERVMLTDVRMFLSFLLLQACNLFAALYLAYPRAGSAKLSILPQFNSPWEAFYATLYFALDRKRIDDEMDVTDSDGRIIAIQELNEWYHIFGIALFASIYVYAIVLLVILLVRLLMAMLTATFNKVRSESVLEWRLQLARRVLVAELIVGSFFGDESLQAGVRHPKSGKYYHSFLGCNDHSGVDVWNRMRMQLGGIIASDTVPSSESSTLSEISAIDTINESDSRNGSKSGASGGHGSEADATSDTIQQLRALLKAVQAGGNSVGSNRTTASAATCGFFQSVQASVSLNRHASAPNGSTTGLVQRQRPARTTLRGALASQRALGALSAHGQTRVHP